MTGFAAHKNVMTRYLDTFNHGDLNGLLALFGADARVYSPTQAEPRDPKFFYPGLLERSQGVVFTTRSMFKGETENQAGVLFDYSKPFPDGKTIVFDCVDIFTFDADGKIGELRIIFDTKNLTAS